MISKNYIHFIDMLREATDRGQVKWTQGSFRGFSCNHNGFFVAVWPYQDEDSGIMSYNLSIEIDGLSTPFTAYDGDKGFYELRSLNTSASASANDLSNKLKRFFD